MANTLSFDQIATLVTSIANQATGKSNIVPTDTSSFVAVAQTALLTGYDPVIKAMSQILSKTIFSTRPYDAKFKSIQVDNQTYGNHVRKMNIIDKPFEEDARYTIKDGQEYNMFRVNLPQILQTNFYGAQVFQKSYTWMKDQIDAAFRNPDELAAFWGMVTQNNSDMIEQAHENLARACVANIIGGKIWYASDHNTSPVSDGVVHLLSEYKVATGQAELTAQSVLTGDNYPNFIRWCAARVGSICKKMTERSQKFHVNITGKAVMRHTPLSMQRVYMFTEQMEQIMSMVLSNTFHDNKIKFRETEEVNFWQSIETPDSVNVTPSVMNIADGTFKKADAVNQSNVFGLICDVEALGYTVVNQWSGTTPFDVRHGFATTYHHFTDRYWNDFTENAVVLLMD